ncbi:MAG: Cold shock domain family protein [Fibrobacteres bacterium]|nr:Cold shock domain family protein [Fibrobacterota bacterium]
METRMPAVLTVLAVLAILACKSVDLGGPGPDGNPIPKDSTAYACKGKTQCGEMVSCKEAEFYLKNCPDVILDGDLDVVPCEEQLCGH